MLVPSVSILASVAIVLSLLFWCPAFDLGLHLVFAACCRWALGLVPWQVRRTELGKTCCTSFLRTGGEADVRSAGGACIDPCAPDFVCRADGEGVAGSQAAAAGCDVLPGSLLFSQSVEALLLVDEQSGRILAGNSAAAHLTGRSERELTEGSLRLSDLLDTSPPPSASQCREEAEIASVADSRPSADGDDQRPPAWWQAFVRADDGGGASSCSPVVRVRRLLHCGVGDSGGDGGESFSDDDKDEVVEAEVRLCPVPRSALWLLSLCDRPPRRAARQAMQRSEFVAALSHEMRAPLTAVVSVTQLLADTPLTAEQRELVHTIQGGGDALLSLVNDFLDLSRLEAHKLRLQCVEFDLPDLLESAVELAARAFPDRRLHVVLQLDPSVPQWVRGDPVRLRQVLLNTVGNAIKFTRQGEVVVSARLQTRSSSAAALAAAVTLEASASPPRGDGKAAVPAHSQHHARLGADAAPAGAATPDAASLLVVTVRDTGIGIDPARIPTLFTAYAQAYRRRAGGLFGGTGLGLAVSRRLCERMHGFIRLQSAGEGQGTTCEFGVSLLAATVSDAGRARGGEAGVYESPAAAAGAAAEADGMPYRAVLLVAHRALRQQLSAQCSRHGWVVACADSVDDAVLQCRQHRVHLLLYEHPSPSDAAAPPAPLPSLALARAVRDRLLASEPRAAPPPNPPPAVLAVCQMPDYMPVLLEAEAAPDRPLAGVLPMPVRRDALGAVLRRLVAARDADDAGAAGEGVAVPPPMWPPSSPASGTLRMRGMGSPPLADGTGVGTSAPLLAPLVPLPALALPSSKPLSPAFASMPLLPIALSASSVSLQRLGDAARSGASTPVPSPATTPALRVLLADDSSVTRRVHTLLLQRMQAAVTAVTDGEQAVAAATDPSSAFDAVLLDWHMPRLEGPAAARAIRAHFARLGRPAPVLVAVTGDVAAADSAHGDGGGGSSSSVGDGGGSGGEAVVFDAVLIKPLLLATLQARLYQLLSDRKTAAAAA